MDAARDWKEQADAILRGEPGPLRDLEAVVTRVVRSFQFGHRDIDLDLVQDALSRILVNLSEGRFRGESSLATWARHIARYTCLDHIRRRRWEVAFDPESLPSSDLHSGPEQSFLWEEEHIRNLEAFATLPAECRDLLKMICLDDVSYRDAARRLGISEAALKSRIHRCRLTCREAAGLVSRPARRLPPRSER